MPRALIFGLDLRTPGVTLNASQIMGHERGVRASFLATAPNGTTADIVMSGNDPIIDGEPDLFARIPRVSNQSNGPVVDLYNWLATRHADYDVLVFSYTTDQYYRTVLSDIIRDYGITVFQAGENTNTESNTGFQNSVFTIAGGASEVVTTRNRTIYGFTTALDKPSNQRNVTSWTTGAAAGYYARFVNLNLSFEQTRKAFIQAHPDYPARTFTRGFGRTPETAIAPEAYDLFPVPYLFVFPNAPTTTAKRYALYFANFTPQDIDGYRVYANGQMIYEGMAFTASGSVASYTGERGQQLFVDTFQNVPVTFGVSCYKGVTESPIDAYVTFTANVTGIAQPSATAPTAVVPAPPPAPPPPEPTPPPTPPDPEPIPAIAPTITGFTRNGVNVTLNLIDNVTGATIQRRTPDGQFVTIGSSALPTFADVVPDIGETYIYRGLNGIGEIGNTVFIAGERTERGLFNMELL
jgi:hypothetical protein